MTNELELSISIVARTRKQQRQEDVGDHDETQLRETINVRARPLDNTSTAHLINGRING